MTYACAPVPLMPPGTNVHTVISHCPAVTLPVWMMSVARPIRSALGAECAPVVTIVPLLGPGVIVPLLASATGHRPQPLAPVHAGAGTAHGHPPAGNASKFSEIGNESVGLLGRI